MIHSEDLFPIGRLTRTHGVQGELELQFTDDAFDRGTALYIILLIDGIFVPFFFEEYRFKNKESALFKLEEVANETQARQLVGIEVFYPHQHLSAEETPKLRSLKALVGYTVLLPDIEDSPKEEELATRELGTVSHVAETNSNAVLTVFTNEGEVLLPFHSDFLIDWNARERYLLLQLPEGLLDINTNSRKEK